MRCCVPYCKNDSRHLSKSEGITFHTFPSQATLKQSWLKALGRNKWQPKDSSAVCSSHFLTEDLYETKSGLRKVKSGAIPSIPNDTLQLDSVKVCVVCLSHDCKLYATDTCSVNACYEQLTGASLRPVSYICAWCYKRLNSYKKLKEQSVKANKLLSDALIKYGNITKQNLKALDKKISNLSLNFEIKYFNEDSIINLNHDLIEKVNLEQNPSFNIDVEVKNEIEEDIIFTETQELKKENRYRSTENEFSNAENVFPNAENEFPNTENEFPNTENEFCKTENELPNRNDDFSDDNRENGCHIEKVFTNLENDFHNSDSSFDVPINQLKKKKKKVKEKKKKVPKKVPTEPKIDRRRKPFLNEDLNETLFTITDLTFEEQVAEIDKRQESSNYKNAIYKCTECFKGFLDEDAYESHMVRHTDACGEHECKICKTHFKHPHALRKHITAHHTHRFNCNTCSYVTTHRQTARLHERWHKGTKYKCPHCQDEFVKFTTYMGHIRIKHPSDFVCQLCGYSFVSEKGIELHKKLKHRLDDNPIPETAPLCELCNVRFVSEEALRRHMQVSARHTEGNDKETKELNAPKRPRKSREKIQKDRKDRDTRRDSSEKGIPYQIRKAEGPIPCEQCGMELEDSRAYHGHFRRMHPDKNRTNYPSMKSPCMCEVCGRMFQSFALLKDHTWVHTGEKPFKCEVCSKSFRMKQRLVAHRRVHAHTRATYVCTMCGKHFSTHSNRQRHMFIHTGLKPFKCEMCGKSFKHASEKRAHITYVHLKKPWPKRTRGKRGYDRGQNEMEDQLRDGEREMEIIQPLWPSCSDPKLNDINQIIDDKPMYYNLKI